MGDLVDSKERTPGDFILFALGFLGFVLAAAGIVIGSVAGAVCGWLLLIFALLCFIGFPNDDT